MIKTVTKKVCICDMCGYTYGWSKTEIVPKEVFEFTVNLADGAKNIQICPRCQVKLRSELKESLNKFYGEGGKVR